MLRNCTTFNGSWLLHCNARCIDISKWVCQLLFHLKCKRRTSKGVYQWAKQSNFFFAKTLISAASSSYVEEVDKSLLKLKICSSVPADSVKKHSVIEFLLPKFLARDAEIRWAVKVVSSHFSYRSNVSMKPLFLAVFLDNASVKEHIMTKGKVSYYINNEIASVFRDEMLLTCMKW